MAVAPGLGAVELPLGARSGTMEVVSDGLITLAISISDSELMPVPPAALDYIYGIASSTLVGSANTWFELTPGTHECRFTSSCDLGSEGGIEHVGQVQEQSSDGTEVEFQPHDSLFWSVNGYATESRGKASRVRFTHVCSLSGATVIDIFWPTWCKVIKILAFFVWGLHWICWNKGCDQPRWQDDCRQCNDEFWRAHPQNIPGWGQVIAIFVTVITQIVFGGLLRTTACEKDGWGEYTRNHHHNLICSGHL